MSKETVQHTTEAIAKWAEERDIKITIASANNHYAGFEPATANVFRQMMGVPEAVWQAKKRPTLSDFSDLPSH